MNDLQRERSLRNCGRTSAAVCVWFKDTHSLDIPKRRRRYEVSIIALLFKTVRSSESLIHTDYAHFVTTRIYR